MNVLITKKALSVFDISLISKQRKTVSKPLKKNMYSTYLNGGDIFTQTFVYA